MKKRFSSTKCNSNASNTFSKEYVQFKDNFLSAKKAVTIHGFKKQNLPSDKEHSVSISKESNL
jgi:hypothetical protein